jgi:pantoate--beta-alanine ligase
LLIFGYFESFNKIMKIIRASAAMQKLALKIRKTQTIGFVPTMGFLHAGHLSLVTAAKKACDVVIASIFVNPTQFGPKEDLSRYPRDEKGDLAKLRGAGCDYVFLPRAKAIYPPDFQTYVTVETVSQALCGASRPGHFRGVATVVAKLFNLVQPSTAFFGLKDYQQVQVIKAMVRDLAMPVKIQALATVREADGLAMSSRNKYLSSEERILALGISKGLKAAKALAGKGKPSANQLVTAFKQALAKHPSIRIDYIDVRNAQTLEPLKAYLPRRTLMAAAVFVGKTRLIDNRVF